MEYLTENLWALWLAVGIFFLVVELCTTALVSIWFVPAAGITSGLAHIIPSFGWQMAIFAVLSAVFMLLFRKFYLNKMKKKTDEVKPEGKLVGKYAEAVEKIDGHGGRVKCGDIYWRAVSETGESIAKGEKVIITSVKDTTLVIKKENS